MRTFRPAVLIVAIAWCVVGVCGASPEGQQTANAPASPGPTVTSMLDAYWRGNLDIVDQQFEAGTAVAPMIPLMQAWAQSAAAPTWRQAGLVLTLDLAAAAVLRPDPAPQATLVLVALGRTEALRRKEKDEAGLAPLFVQAWMETSVSLEVAAGGEARALAFLRRVDQERAVDMSPALWLQQGLATERLGGPDVTKVLEAAVKAYDRAARDPGQRAEASARAAHALNRMRRYRDAIRRLDVAGDGTEDVAVATWLAHLRGVALEGLGEDAEAVAAHEQARALMPGQADPWTSLERGDARTIVDGIRRLRASLAPAADPEAEARSAVFEIFDAYERADYGALAASLRIVDSLEAFSASVRDVADRWVRDAPPSATVRRQRVIAMVALEAAQAKGLSDWPRAHLLVEWACERLRAAPVPDEFERRWHHAVATLMAGAVQPAPMEVHLTHALARVPDDDALVMDRAVAAELRAGPDIRSTSGLKPPGAQLNVVTARLEQAAGHPADREEAHLRLGYTALRRGFPNEALVHLDTAAGSSDAVIRYLAQLLRGRAFDKLQRPNDAVSAYEAATETVPGAQTAVIALAAAYSRQGDPVRSAEVAERALALDPTIQDPWLYYGQGDFRHWPRIVADLQALMLIPEDAR
ncbi:MAG: hypothetical protein R2752_04370 [Vicinamibacterales bacterium]